jgi:hypothetical protein
MAAWRWAMAAAAVVLLAVALFRPGRQQSRAFLTDEALEQVQRAEAAYAQSIEKLSQVAGPALEQSPAPLASAYREKLLLLDSEIAEIKAASEGNRYSAYVQTQLASLYREAEDFTEWLNMRSAITLLLIGCAPAALAREEFKRDFSGRRRRVGPLAAGEHATAV